MKLLITADLHLSLYKNKRIVGDLPLPLYYTKVNLDNMAKTFKEENCGAFVIAGDLFHDKSHIYMNAYNILKEFILENDKIPFWIITGNHDISDIKGDINTLDSLEQFENVKIIKKYEKYENVYLLSYNKYQIDLLRDMIENLDYDQFEDNILISHFGVDEGSLSTGMSIRTGIKAKDLFNGFKRIVLGHYHKPQELKSEDGEKELIYVGSPIQLNWGEKNEEKRFMILDTETLKYKFIPTETQKYVEIEINSIDDLKEFEDEYDLSDINNIYRIKTTLDRKDILEEKQVIKDLNIPIIEQEKVSEDNTEGEEENVIRLSNNMSREDLFREYLNIKEVNEKYRDEYIKVLMSHIGEV